MKKVASVLFVIAVIVALSLPAIANGVTYLSDGNITVKVWQKNISDQLRHAGWKDVSVTDKIAAEIADYGPKDDSLVKENGILIYPIFSDADDRQDRNFHAKWYAYSLKGYAEKVAARLTDLSAYLKK